MYVSRNARIHDALMATQWRQARRATWVFEFGMGTGVDVVLNSSRRDVRDLGKTVAMVWQRVGTHWWNFHLIRYLLCTSSPRNSKTLYVRGSERAKCFWQY